MSSPHLSPTLSETLVFEEIYFNVILNNSITFIYTKTILWDKIKIWVSSLCKKFTMLTYKSNKGLAKVPILYCWLLKICEYDKFSETETNELHNQHICQKFMTMSFYSILPWKQKNVQLSILFTFNFVKQFFYFFLITVIALDAIHFPPLSST